MLICILVATPFTIRLFGPSRYGLWSLFQTLLTWATLADVGMGTTSTTFAAERYAHGDDRGEVAVVWTALAITVTTTACAAVVMILAAPGIFSNLLHVSGALRKPGILALRIICTAFVAQVIMGIVNTPQVVRLRWRQYTLVTRSADLLQVVGVPVALAAMTGSVVTAAVVALVAATVGAAGNVALGARLQPALFPPRVDCNLLRPLLTCGASLSLSSLAAIPLMTAERFLLGHYHSTTVVAYYAVAASLGTILAELPSALAAPLLPGLVRLGASDKVEEHHTLYRRSLQGLFLLMTPTALLLAFLGHAFLSVWAGPKYAMHSTGPFLIIVVGQFFNALVYVPWSYLVAAGRAKTVAWVHIAELPPYLIVAAIMAAKFGAMGAAIVWSARVVIDALVFFIVTGRTAGLPWSPLPTRRVMSIVSVMALAGALMAVSTLSANLGPRVIWAAGLGSLYMFAVWRIVLTVAERRGLAGMVAEITPWLKGPPSAA